MKRNELSNYKVKSGVIGFEVQAVLQVFLILVESKVIKFVPRVQVMRLGLTPLVFRFRTGNMVTTYLKITHSCLDLKWSLPMVSWGKVLFMCNPSTTPTCLFTQTFVLYNASLLLPAHWSHDCRLPNYIGYKQITGPWLHVLNYGALLFAGTWTTAWEQPWLQTSGDHKHYIDDTSSWNKLPVQCASPSETDSGACAVSLKGAGC